MLSPVTKNREPTGHLWHQVQQTGLLNEINSFEKYERTYANGLILARQCLERLDNLDLPSPDLLRLTHYLIFKEVHPWAGSFRQIGQVDAPGARFAVETQRIEPELLLAARQAASLLEYPIVACAFFHLRFEAIHPFRDGNGRTGRTILAAQIYSRWQEDLVWQREPYLAALHAGMAGDLTPLINYLLDSLGHTDQQLQFPYYSPYRIAPLYLGDPRIAATLEEALEQSKVAPEYWTKK